MSTTTPTVAGARPVREQIEANRRALTAAHGAPLRAALESVRWERRGLLQRLTRHPR